MTHVESCLSTDQDQVYAMALNKKSFKLVLIHLFTLTERFILWLLPAVTPATKKCNLSLEISPRIEYVVLPSQYLICRRYTSAVTEC